MSRRSRGLTALLAVTAALLAGRLLDARIHHNHVLDVPYIGINVNNDPPPGVDNAASIGQLTGKPHSRIEILSRFLDRFEERMSAGSLDTIITDVLAHERSR